MLPSIDSIRQISTDTVPAFWDAVNVWHGTPDHVFFHKEFYAVSQGISFEGTPFAYSLGNENWIVLLLLAEFFVYAFSLVRFGKEWKGRISNVWRVKEDSGLFDENKKVSQNGFLYLLLTSVNIALFAYQAMCGDVAFYANRTQSVWHFIAFVSVVFLLRYLLAAFVGRVYFPAEKVDYLRSEIFSLFSYLGLALFPVVLLMIYGNFSLTVLVWWGIVILSIYLILELYKIFCVFYFGIGTFFYLFLYLCTLEVLPIVLLYSVLTIVE